METKMFDASRREPQLPALNWPYQGTVAALREGRVGGKKMAEKWPRSVGSAKADENRAEASAAHYALFIV